HVPQHPPGFALQRVAPAASAGDFMPVNVTTLDNGGELAGHDTIFSVRIDHVVRMLARRTAVKAEGGLAAPVRSHLQDRLVLEEAVLAIEWRPAAELTGTCPIGQEFVAKDLDRLLCFSDLDRV